MGMYTTIYTRKDSKKIGFNGSEMNWLPMTDYDWRLIFHSPDKKDIKALYMKSLEDVYMITRANNSVLGFAIMGCFFLQKPR